MRRLCLPFVLFFNTAVFAQTDAALINKQLADIEAMQSCIALTSFIIFIQQHIIKPCGWNTWC